MCGQLELPEVLSLVWLKPGTRPANLGTGLQERPGLLTKDVTLSHCRPGKGMAQASDFLMFQELIFLFFLFLLPLLVCCLAEGEAEAEWLQDAGLSDLIKDHASENDNVVLLSTLTKTQAAAVQRRLDTYSRSRRRKNKHPVRDVRDIFGVVGSGVC